MSKLIRPQALPLYRPGMKFPSPGIVSRRALIRGMTDTDQIGQQQGDRTYSFDANMALSDGAAAIAASGYAQYAGADGIVDLGGNQNVTITLPSIADVSTITPQQARIDAVAVIDVTAVTVSGTAIAKMMLVGSNNPAFSAGTVAILGMMEFGAAASIDAPNAFVTGTPPAVGGSRYEILFSSEQNNVKYEYVKLYVLIANSGSITFKAFIAVLPEP
jgi:hypothetical protein